MKIVRFKTLAWLLPLLAFFAAGALLRADDPPASPDKQTPSPAPTEQAPAAELSAEPTPPPAAAVPSETTAPGEQPAVPMEEVAAPSDEDKAAQAALEAAETARAQAERALADADKAVKKARAGSEKARNEARAAAERAREEARAAVREVQKQVSEIKRAKRTRTSNAGDRVMVGDDNVVAAATVVPHDAVAVMGNLTVDGEVMNDAVAVLGDNTINGRVHGNAVAVLGNLTLGPKAVVDGNLTCVMGEIQRDPGAIVRGSVEVQSIGPNIRPASLISWWDRALRVGRPLAFGAHLGWLWIITAFSLAFYALLGVLFPNKIAACGDKLIEEPFYVILAAMLSILALPVMFVLLCITIIGIPVALLVLPVACLLTAMFGKAAIYGLVGRKLTGGRFHTAFTVLLGGILFILLYLVPVLGGILTLLVWFLGFGCAVLVMFGREKKPAAPVAPAPAAAAAFTAPVAGETTFGATPAAIVPPAPAMPAQSAGFGAASAPVWTPPATPVAGPAPEVVPPVYGASTAASAVPPLMAATLPRAGLWIRAGAALIDFVMLVIPLGIFGALEHGPGALFVGIAAYHAVMWKLRGTTVGGIICRLKVVRLDDRPIDWAVAIVRALTAFLSFFPACLGFIWVSFDEEKQSWHDRVAGTTIVRVPKGTSLL
ncbi:MAG: RDD family protein [Candidatus Didemnitutus sp.]|nr:RDD family protein [Candidatus Didemnitutus sp.]